MTQHIDEPQKPRKRVYRRGWFIGLVVLILLGAVVIATLPFGIAYGVKRALLAAGAQQAVVEDVDFNPFVGVLVVKNLGIQVAGERTLVLPRASVRLRWRELFLNQRILIDDILIRGDRITIHRRDDGTLAVGGIQILAPGQAAEPPAEAQPRPIIKGYGVAHIGVAATTIVYRDPAMQAELVIDELELTRIASWEADRAASVSFKGTLNSTPYSLEGEIKAFGDDRTLEGQLTLDGLSLENFAKAAEPALQRLRGNLKLSSQMFVIYSADKLRVAQKGTVSVSGLALGSPEAEVDTKSIAWNGRNVVTLAGERLAVESEGKLSSGALRLRLVGADTVLDNKSLSWDGRNTLAIEADTLNLESQGKLTTGALRAELAKQGVTAENEGLAWNGQTQLSQTAGRLEVKTGGELKSGALRAELAKQGVTAENKGLTWNGQTQLSQTAGRLDVKTGGELKSGALRASLTSPAASFADAGVRWKGNVHLSGTGEDTRLVVEGELGSDKLEITLADEGLHVTGDGLGWTGRFAQAPKQTPDLTASGDLRVAATRVDDASRGVRLADFSSLEIRQISLQGTNQIGAGSIKVNELNALAPLDDRAGAESDETRPLVRSKNLVLSDIALTELKHLNVETVEFSSLDALMRKRPEGQWFVLDDLLAAAETGGPATGTPPVAESPGAGPPMQFRVGRFQVTGESKLAFEDQSVTPDYRLDLELERLELKDLDSAKPEQPSPLLFAAKAGKYSTVSFDGTMQPFAKDLSLVLKGELKSFDMAPLSAYSSRMFGYDLRSGQLDAKINLAIDKGEMDGTNELLLRKLTLKVSDPEVIEKSQRKLSMPLDLALNMLRDKNDNIKLKVPIKGNVNDPNVDITDAINTVLAKAVAKAAEYAAMSYLRTALFPYGTLVSVAKIGAGQIRRVRLDPIEFAPGESQLAAEGQQYLGKIAGIMQKRPELELRLCTQYTGSDAQALATKQAEATKQVPPGTAQAAAAAAPTGPPAVVPLPPTEQLINQFRKELVALARQRADELKQQINLRHGVAAERLIVCQPAIDQGKEAKPRVELLF